jgi:hypothetical protein
MQCCFRFRLYRKFVPFQFDQVKVDSREFIQGVVIIRAFITIKTFPHELHAIFSNYKHFAI